MIDEEIAFFSDWAKMRDCLPDADEIQVGALSLQLRRMLVDRRPLFHIVNRKYHKKILFPRAPSEKKSVSENVNIYLFPKEIISGGEYLSVKLPEFMSHRILEINETKFSIKDVIKLVANNLGGVHFDHEAATEVSQLDLKNSTIILSLKLAIYHIAKATSAALKDLADLCSPFPDYGNFLGHYSAGDAGRHFISFESQQWMEVKYPKNTVTPSLSVLAVLEPLPQEHKKAFLMSFELRDTAVFDISISSDGDIGAGYKRGKRKLDVLVEDARKIRPIGKKIYIRTSIEKKALSTSLEIEVQGRCAAETFDYPINNLDLMRCVIGARGNGNRGAAFLIKELCILSTGDEGIQKSIIQYFKYRYFQ